MSDPRSSRQAGFREAVVELAHGAGGRASRRMLEELFLPSFDNPALSRLEDSATLPWVNGSLAFTTDGFVVRPLEFPGGSIGSLAVHGTVNDLAVAGAEPEALVATFILEAGLPVETLEREVRAMGEAARKADVPVVGGDTKVVEHGRADGIYISVAGIGRVDPRIALDARAVRPGDRVLLTGPIGDHGVTVLLARGELELDADLRSDSRSVLPFARALREAVPGALRWMRDPTRGGVGTALNELAAAAGLGIEIEESSVPVRDAVRGACELLGLDPLHIANEGQCLAVVAAEVADRALEAWRGVEGGDDAAIVGRVVDRPAGVVTCRTDYGAARIVDVLVGDPLPRIC